MPKGIVRGVLVDLNVDEIKEGITWPNNPLQINHIERLKFKDRFNNLELKDSSSIKIDFLSERLSEYIYIWNTKCRVYPFINRVRKCHKCLRWGHSERFCKNKETTVCLMCGGNHNTETCNSEAIVCNNCKGCHDHFNTSCPVFKYHNIINTVRAYCNVNIYNAKSMIRSRNITDCNQVRENFKSHAYLSWFNLEEHLNNNNRNINKNLKKPPNKKHFLKPLFIRNNKDGKMITSLPHTAMKVNSDSLVPSVQSMQSPMGAMHVGDLPERGVPRPEGGA
ncbi:hypothetical protein ALC62_15338 [Cyphomyrmex costatus]|uniref:Nucleic-acid-binding protein from mobile element jockey n=1 Tax=Cyphomyrmex costatus TaxID=456900 RepID=A0A151I7V5_9HYME|nr:hypothetical protein ALC62_15338 [Cyphomyrmex costatus]